MANVRLVARLDIKGPHLIKGINLEGLRKMGNPNEFAARYYQQGADELIYIDAVASLYERNSLLGIIEEATRDIFIPITVGGGIRSIEDANKVLRAGADKVAVNTAAIKQPGLISQISQRFGSQCMVLSIEAKQVGPGRWEAYYDNGREKTGIDVLEWARKGVELGAGELLITSVDREGTARGFDVELIRAVTDTVAIPVIASGGMGSVKDLECVVQDGHADAVAMAHVLHYHELTLQEIRTGAAQAGIPVRNIAHG